MFESKRFCDENVQSHEAADLCETFIVIIHNTGPSQFTHTYKEKYFPCRQIILMEKSLMQVIKDCNKKCDSLLIIRKYNTFKGYMLWLM